MKTKNLIMLIALLTGWVAGGVKATPPTANNSYVYQSKSLNAQISMPAEWQDKVKVTETDQSVTFTYVNAGGQPVFLYSLTKLDEQTWMNVRDQITNVHIVAEKGGMIYFVQLTDKTSIKGANAKEFKSIVSDLDGVMHNIKVS